MNPEIIVTLVSTAIDSLLKILSVAGLSNEELLKVQSSVNVEINRILSQQKTDEERENAIVNGH